MGGGRTNSWATTTEKVSDVEESCAINPDPFPNISGGEASGRVGAGDEEIAGQNNDVENGDQEDVVNEEICLGASGQEEQLHDSLSESGKITTDYSPPASGNSDSEENCMDTGQDLVRPLKRQREGSSSEEDIPLAELSKRLKLRQAREQEVGLIEPRVIKHTNPLSRLLGHIKRKILVTGRVNVGC